MQIEVRKLCRGPQPIKFSRIGGYQKYLHLYIKKWIDFDVEVESVRIMLKSIDETILGTEKLFVTIPLNAL